MKTFKTVAVMMLLAVMVICATACSQAPANTVFNADDMMGKKIGVQQGTTGDIYVTGDYTNEEKEEGDEMLENPSEVIRYKNGNEAVLALKQGKVDCVVIDSEPAKEYVKQNPDLKILDDPFALEEYAICFKKGSALTAEFNTALAALKADGTFESIVNNFIGDNAGKTPYVTPEGTTYTKGKLTMATNAFFPPYEFYKDNKIVGIDASVAQAICDKLGYELEIKDMSFDAILTAVETGQASFGMAGMTVTEKRLESVDFSDSYTTATQVIIVRAK